MSKLLINISYASIEAYEFDGINRVDDIPQYQYHQIRKLQRDDNSTTDAETLYNEVLKELSDAYGNEWKNNLELAILWSPEFSDPEKSAFKQLLIKDGVENFDFYDPQALSNYLLQSTEKFNASCNYAINLWANQTDVYIQLYQYTQEGIFKFIGKTVAEKAAEDPRVEALTQKMMNELQYCVEDIENERTYVRNIATNFINSGKTMDNVVVRLSSGYEKISTLTNEYKNCSTNSADILNRSLDALLNKFELNANKCQVVLSTNFAKKSNLLEVARRMFIYVCNESAKQEDSVLSTAFKQMDYTIKNTEHLQKRIAFCGDGRIIDRPALITWKCPKCGYTCECEKEPKECPKCHGSEIPDTIGELTIDATMHENRTGKLFWAKTERRVEIKITPANGGINVKLLLIVGKRPIGVYDRNIEIDRWTLEFPNGINRETSIIVTQQEYPALAQDGFTYIDIKPHWSYQDVNAFVVETKKI